MLIPQQIDGTTAVNHVRHGRLLKCGAVYFGRYVKFQADVLPPFSRLPVGVPTAMVPVISSYIWNYERSGNKIGLHGQ